MKNNKNYLELLKKENNNKNWFNRKKFKSKNL